MGQVAGTTFGLGTPTLHPMSTLSWGLSPYAGPGIDPFGQSAYLQGLSGQQSTGYGSNAPQPLQQILQILQVVPQQLQQLQQLQYVQQQQFLQLQQVLHFVPAQLQQLQQLIQSVPQQLQHLQQRQALSSTIPGQIGFGVSPQVFATPPVGQVM